MRTRWNSAAWGTSLAGLLISGAVIGCGADPAQEATPGTPQMTTPPGVQRPLEPASPVPTGDSMPAENEESASAAPLGASPQIADPDSEFTPLPGSPDQPSAEADRLTPPRLELQIPGPRFPEASPPGTSPPDASPAAERTAPQEDPTDGQ